MRAPCVVMLGAVLLAAAAPPPTLSVLYMSGAYPAPAMPSLVETTPPDAGLAGARLGAEEIRLMAGLLGPTASQVTLVTATYPAVPQGAAIIVADLQAPDLLALASRPEAKGAVILDIRTRDDALRGSQCRPAIFHLLPSHAMQADAIAQYLVWKNWRRWFLLRGPAAADQEIAADVHRAAARYGARITAERTYAYDPGARRVDTGYQQIQTQMPQATQVTNAHDVLYVADEADLFGDYLSYATFDPHPVVGTQGLVATAWTPAYQEYSALQMQHRFNTRAGRLMTEADYAGWLALRIVGEAALRFGAHDAFSLRAVLRNPKFGIAGFKGEAMNFRPWDQQLRQPVLLATPLLVVSSSPQEGFLSPTYLTDTLGFDAPESACHLGAAP